MALMLPRLKHSFTGLARTAPHDHGGCIALIFRRILGWMAQRAPPAVIRSPIRETNGMPLSSTQ